ncbi:Phosphoribosylaminoimidazole-succinocarboxamide synthase [Cordyceps militaris]|uniref:Phosphoribosylaminoimidazole-succinocarboxamide synthase n=1 Tax=Cordyceps militaris TaxID=73501 RepID=A0A2H4SE55_CORMI|nr:Phosphoribosylaminoimidazole-succinocarboxamide synthase [Cordyceps militaris]
MATTGISRGAERNSPGGPCTHSTKAPIGEKDENISPEQARKLVGDKYANQIEA